MNDVATAAPAKFVPKILKIVTVPLLKLRPGMTVYLKIIDALKRAEPLKHVAAPTDGTKAKEPPVLFKAVNLETGEPVQCIAGTLLVDVFADHYPNDSYINKGFMITVNEQKASAGGGGKRYNTYAVNEIELPEPPKPAEPVATETPAANGKARK